MSKKRFVLGADVGGTFTDVVAVDEEGGKWTAKAPSTPSSPEIGVINAVKKIAAGVGTTVEGLVPDIVRFVYGTTVATNALLERKGIEMAVITTRGFRDTLILRRMRREGGFDIWSRPHDPIVPRRSIYEVTERIDFKGNIITPLVEADVKSVAEELRKTDIKSVAVSLLFSPVNPVHERRLKELLIEELPHLRVSISSDVCPEIREYERTSTTAVNAFLIGTVEKHLDHLHGELKKRGLKTGVQIMQSSGGVTTADFAAERPINIFLSGPAGGTVAASYLGQLLETKEKNFLAVDMGGTSFDICLITEGSIPTSMTNTVHGWSLIAPSIDIRTVGAGGGSIAWVDVGGGLHVGPQSSGATPGPACYMRGGEEATVTDADLVLGYLNPDYFLGGEMELSLEKAQEVIERVADKVGLPPTETANGIFRIVNNNMLEATRLATVGKGYDPRDYTVVVFGGAGAIHLPAFAAELGIKHIIVPRDASEFCALGVVVSDVRFDFVKNINRNSADITIDELLAEYAVLKQQGSIRLEELLIEPEDRYFRFEADMKFPGEYSEFLVDIPNSISSMEEVRQIFIDHHRRQYEYAEDASPDVVNIRLSAFGKAIKPKISRAETGSENCDGAIKAERNAYFYEAEGSISTPIYDGQRIVPGNRLLGPAIIELPTTTIVVRPHQSMYMDELSNFNISC